MGKKLVIVESPSKAKTIAGILGHEYRVVASMGHVRDLPRKALGIDIEARFHPHYVLASGKKKTVDRLKKEAADVEAVYLATDLDREGEAIAWHVLEVLRRSLPKDTSIYRVTFHEITHAAILDAFRQVRSLNMDLVNAQQTRRILDRLVGYSISPLLWQHIQGVRGLSAGRVQTVALRLVVDREREIQAFVPVEYWSIAALLQQKAKDETNPLGLVPPQEPVPFLAQLWRIRDDNAAGPDPVWKKPDLKNRDDTQAIVAALENALYWVDKVETQRKPRHPWPPFTTSTMQQAAAKALGFAPKLTMQIAQQLYEGIKLEQEGRVGLITYMRTDSTYVAPEAQQAAREVVAKYWGTAYLPDKPPTYKTRVKSAQEAHEAIRPTDPHRTPQMVKPDLDEKQFKLYELIWRRFIASQMKPALYDLTTALIPTALESREDPLPFLFRAQGRVCIFEGFLKVYQEHKDIGEEPEQDQALPPLTESEWLELLELIPEQHWTQPPPRYTEASLIKELERRGIGRPSTFATMVAIIKDRGYVQHQGPVLIPTELGFAVCDMLVASFADLFDYGFTAQMEDQLDDVANKQIAWVSVLDKFWQALSPAVDKARTNMSKVTIEQEKPQPIGQQCPRCGADLVRRKGKYGYFIGCSNYPKCEYLQKTQRTKSKPAGKTCPQCGSELVIRQGKRGEFVGCSNYPKCKHTEKAPS